MTTSLPKLAACVGGIYFFYLYYGYFQEAIYHPSADGSRFSSTYFLLLVQCATNACVAMLGLSLLSLLSGSTKSAKSGTGNAGSKDLSLPATSAPNYLKSLCGQSMTGHTWMAVISFTYVTAMGCSNAALQYVNYPTQALGKSCKMIPVMLFDVLINKKQYKPKEYAAALLITAGIVVFRIFKGSSKASTANSTVGLFLLLGSLCLDGLTTSNQKNYRKEFAEPSLRGTLRMMLHTNMWACVHVAAISLAMGHFATGLAFCTEHPEILGPILKFCICSALGQVFIFLTVTGPGPLACTTITTTRKFFTILLSVLMYPENSLTTEQWLGVGSVFGGLALKISEDARDHGKAKSKAKLK